MDKSCKCGDTCNIPGELKNMDLSTKEGQICLSEFLDKLESDRLTFTKDI